MSTILTDTTSAQISAALLRARRNAGSPSMGMVLTMIIVCGEKDYEDALQASTRAGREHPARILLVVTAGGRTSGLDAEVRLGEGTPGEVVVLRMRGPVGTHPASVIRPLLLPDSPVVIWWPGACPAGPVTDELSDLAVRRLTDAGAVGRPRAALMERAKSYRPGDTDLAWTRLTRWRGLLAAALDQYPTRIKAVTVESERGNPSADLLAVVAAESAQGTDQDHAERRPRHHRGADEHGGRGHRHHPTGRSPRLLHRARPAGAVGGVEAPGGHRLDQ